MEMEDRCRFVSDLFIKPPLLLLPPAAFIFLASASSTGRGILDSQGMSGDGDAILGDLAEAVVFAAEAVVDGGVKTAAAEDFEAAAVFLVGGPDMMSLATFWMSLSHSSQRLNEAMGAFSSGPKIGLPDGRLASTADVFPPPPPLAAVNGKIIADAATDFVAGLSPTLASRVAAGRSVMVDLVFWFMYWEMLRAEDFRDDFRDTLGEVDDLRREAMVSWDGRW